MRKILDIASLAIWTLAAVAVAVRFTVRDALPATAWIYYFFGLPVVIAGLLAAGAAVSLLAGRVRRFAVAATLAAAVAASWWSNSRYENPCRSADDSIRIVSWNVSRLRGGGETVAAELAALNPDVALLVEGGNDNENAWNFWRERFRGYDLALPGSGIVALVRGSIEASGYRRMTGISAYAQFDILVDGRPLRVAVADLDASPRFDKRLLVPRVFDLATTDLETPVVVAGDFNTPIDSPAFRRARNGFRHVFETSGTGLLATWPAAYPVTAIDHVWTDRSIDPLCASLFQSSASDHRAVVADIRY